MQTPGQIEVYANFLLRHRPLDFYWGGGRDLSETFPGPDFAIQDEGKYYNTLCKKTEYNDRIAHLKKHISTENISPPPQPPPHAHLLPTIKIKWSVLKCLVWGKMDAPNELGVPRSDSIPVLNPMRKSNGSPFNCGTLNPSIVLIRSRDNSAMSMVWRLPFLSGRPLATMYTSPVEKEEKKKEKSNSKRKLAN